MDSLPFFSLARTAFFWAPANPESRVEGEAALGVIWSRGLHLTACTFYKPPPSLRLSRRGGTGGLSHEHANIKLQAELSSGANLLVGLRPRRFMRERRLS